MNRFNQKANYGQDMKIRMLARFTVALSLLFLMLPAAACTKRGAYEGLRFYQGLDCDRMMGRDREECFRRANMSYDEYQRQLKEREKENENENERFTP